MHGALISSLPAAGGAGHIVSTGGESAATGQFRGVLIRGEIVARMKTIGRRSREIVSKENAELRAYKNGLRFLDVEGAATFLGVSIATLRCWSSNRNGQKPKVPIIKIGRNLARYDRQSLTEWLKQKETWPLQEAKRGEGGKE